MCQLEFRLLAMTENNDQRTIDKKVLILTNCDLNGIKKSIRIHLKGGRHG